MFVAGELVVRRWRSDNGGWFEMGHVEIVWLGRVEWLALKVQQVGL
jgi:hypothetical protein